MSIESEVIATWLVESKLQNNYQRTIMIKEIYPGICTLYIRDIVFLKKLSCVSLFSNRLFHYSTNGFDLRSALSGFFKHPATCMFLRR